MGISVTDKAVNAIAGAAAKRPSPPRGLRVGIRGGGCTGFSYLFEWSDADPRPEDHVLSFQDGKVNVIIDSKSLLFLEGSTLDFATFLETASRADNSRIASNFITPMRLFHQRIGADLRRCQWQHFPLFIRYQWLFEFPHRPGDQYHHLSAQRRGLETP